MGLLEPSGSRSRLRPAPSKPRRLGAARLVLLGSAFVAAWLHAGVSVALDTQDLANYRGWGAEVADAIEAEFRRPGSNIYAEHTNLNGDQFGGINGNAFIWAASVQFRALNSVLALDLSRENRTRVLAYSDELHQRYWTDSADGENGYVVAPGSIERYYDDNAHMTVALMEAYELTRSPRLLARAIATHDFVLEGEDDFQDGGVYFREGTFGNKNTISTLQEARGAAMIYQATGEQRFLDDAARLLEWSNTHVQRSDGLYYQDYRDEGIDDISNVPLTNGAGMGILTNLEMYNITDDGAYLAEAQRVASRSISHFGDRGSGSVWGGGYWAFELVDAWVDLYQHDGNLRWLTFASRAVEFIKADLEDDNGHYGRDWHTVSDETWPELDDWLLIDQAAVARAYLYTGLATPPGVPGDFNEDGVVDAADYTLWRDSYGEPEGTLPNDPNSGVVGEAQYQTWASNYGETVSTPPTPIPEPTAFALAAFALGSLAANRRLVATARRAS